jgi:hypothetical protein
MSDERKCLGNHSVKSQAVDNVVRKLCKKREIDRLAIRAGPPSTGLRVTDLGDVQQVQRHLGAIGNFDRATCEGGTALFRVRAGPLQKTNTLIRREVQSRHGSSLPNKSDVGCGELRATNRVFQPERTMRLLVRSLGSTPCFMVVHLGPLNHTGAAVYFRRRLSISLQE